MSNPARLSVIVCRAFLETLKGLLKQFIWAVPLWIVVFGSYAGFWWYREGSTTHRERLLALGTGLMVVFGGSILVGAWRAYRLRKGGRPFRAEMQRRVAEGVQVGFSSVILLMGILTGSMISLDGAPASILVGNVALYLALAIYLMACVVSMTGIRATPAPSTTAEPDAEHAE